MATKTLRLIENTNSQTATDNFAKQFFFGCIFEPKKKVQLITSVLKLMLKSMQLSAKRCMYAILK